MATVYLAQDLKHGRSVAVKVLDPDIAVSVGADRFLREIRITAGLQHTNILTLIDSGEADGFLYYVMPFADGESLRTRLTRAAGPLPTDEALRILREMIDALAYAHRHGLVHRDIKPENVMLTGRHALVLDFGVAKAVQVAREKVRVGAEGTPNVVSRDALTSVGTSLGTPAYMSPEQAAGDPDVDHRADIYSAGLVAYEMLSGRAPFQGRPHEVMAAQITAKPQPLDEVAPTLPAPLVQLVMRCLEKDASKRPQTADELLTALDALASPPVASRGLWARMEMRLGRPGAIAASLAALAVLGYGGWSLAARGRDTRWVREIAVPEIQRLIDAGQTDSAFQVAERAVAMAPDDSVLRTLTSRISRRIVLRTDPPGARISWTRYADSTGWRDAGDAGDTLWLPNLFLRFRVERPGSRTFERAANPNVVALAGADSVLQLDAADAPDPEMVLVPGGNTTVAMPGLSNLATLRIGDFVIDRHEVTNAEFKRFVDSGGYEKEEYWTEPMTSEGRVLPRAEARRRLVDRTGRPGPASWEAGDFPSGAADLPVGGISWYEAAAYAAFVGKSLPTVYHWNRAASTNLSFLMVVGSNFGSTSPRAGARFAGMSPVGAYDMAGNVREWIQNAVGTQRMILGGGWTDPSYAFVDVYAQDPLDRSLINGIRLAKSLQVDATAAAAKASVVREFRDYTRERPVSDAVFNGLTSMFAYDHSPLDAKVESRDSSNADWVVEHITVASVYGRERLPMTIWVPKRGVAPMQTILVYPGSNAFFETSLSNFPGANLDAVLKTGRIVVLPSYASQYGREHTLASDAPNESALYRDHVAMWSKDLRRTIDYLESRDDVDPSRLAYFGFSFGGRMAPIMLANEPRIKTAVLSVAGLKMERTRPESDPLNYLPRVKIPVLMLNGRFDHYFPLETSQKPFLAMLGTPAADKRHVVYEGGHSVPRTMFISESLVWLDKYLGVPKR